LKNWRKATRTAANTRGHTSSGAKGALALRRTRPATENLFPANDRRDNWKQFEHTREKKHHVLVRLLSLLPVPQASIAPPLPLDIVCTANDPQFASMAGVIAFAQGIALTPNEALSGVFGSISLASWMFLLVRVTLLSLSLAREILSSVRRHWLQSLIV